jgi:hypothetical protein
MKTSQPLLRRFLIERGLEPKAPKDKKRCDYVFGASRPKDSFPEALRGREVRFLRRIETARQRQLSRGLRGQE